MKATVIMVILTVTADFVYSRVFEFCELARELDRQGFPKSQLDDWVCLIRAESSFDTHAVGPPNSDGSKDFGLFQINSRYWCKDSSYRGGHNLCGINCRDLLSSDITEASRCAKLVYKETKKSGKRGFEAWYGWVNRCQGDIPSTERCFTSMGERNSPYGYCSTSK